MPTDGPATGQRDPDLGRILDAWPTLPEPIRRTPSLIGPGRN
jgi:hypothetical protein